MGASKVATRRKTRSKEQMRRQCQTKHTKCSLAKSRPKPNTRQEKAKQDMFSHKANFTKVKHDKMTRPETKSSRIICLQNKIPHRTTKDKTIADIHNGPVKIVYWNDNDDSEVVDWLLSKPCWHLELPKGWVYASDLDPKELLRLQKKLSVKVQHKTMTEKTIAKDPTDPVKIVYWNDNDDSDVDNWLLTRRALQLEMPTGWVYACDLHPDELVHVCLRYLALSLCLVWSQSLVKEIMRTGWHSNEVKKEPAQPSFICKSGRIKLTTLIWNKCGF
jgi:hypothetical protein